MNPKEIKRKIQEIENEVVKLSIQADKLIKLKKQLFSDMDITTPKSTEEKQLDKKTADLFSRINQLISQKKKLRKELSSLETT